MGTDENILELMVMIAQICKYPKMSEFIFQNGEFYIHEISGNAIKKSTWLEKKKKQWIQIGP